MNQNAHILNHLETRGTITPMEALNEYGVFRLAARIADLRGTGVAIETETLRLPTGKRVARYSLEEKTPARDGGL